MSDKPADEIVREFLSPHEFASCSGLSLVTVRRYVDDGRLPAAQPGGHRCRVLIPRSALADFTKKIPTAGRSSTKNITPTPTRKSPAGPAPRWLTDS
jgi:excisionase family DNA binding protein